MSSSFTNPPSESVEEPETVVYKEKSTMEVRQPSEAMSKSQELHGASEKDPAVKAAREAPESFEYCDRQQSVLEQEKKTHAEIQNYVKGPLDPLTEWPAENQRILEEVVNALETLDKEADDAARLAAERLEGCGGDPEAGRSVVPMDKLRNEERDARFERMKDYTERMRECSAAISTMSTSNVSERDKIHSGYGELFDKLQERNKNVEALLNELNASKEDRDKKLAKTRVQAREIKSKLDVVKHDRCVLFSCIDIQPPDVMQYEPPRNTS